MIGSLRGKLVDKRPNLLLIEVGGVGYQVQIPLSTFTGLGPLGGEAALLIHTHVREDALALYGFLTAREKHCFELLISASGVGPSLALKILSGMGIEELVPAIRKADLAQLVRIPGVGRKTAERIVVELRDKLVAVDVPETGKPATRSQLESDVASALVNLGYDERAVEKAVEKARGTGGADFEHLLRGALQILGSSAMRKGAVAVTGATGE
ncbi:MAG TPA: Holliday junction branch migration protein RuvA [Candidatus Acidoferrales bacterium]|nr:Holliday junction branch migration protein RuvA [Candidatus Acidoferrales bacterium]